MALHSQHAVSFMHLGLLEVAEVDACDLEEFQVVCLECGHEFSTCDGDYCENCGGSDIELADE